MFSINRNIIQMNRGDDTDIVLQINTGTALRPIQCTIEEGEAVYFGVMSPNQKWEEAIIRKKLTSENVDEDGNIFLHLDSSDTENVMPGTYYYMVKAYIKDEHLDKYVINTVINKTKFIIW